MIFKEDDSLKKAGQRLASTYEATFCIFLVLSAILWRGITGFNYPEILYLLLALLVLNYVAILSLKIKSCGRWLSALIILGNCATITAILNNSGGPSSSLWVLYLLPIFTVCLLLDKWEVVWITTGTIAFNGTFVLSSTGTLDAAILFDLLIKSGILVFGAASVWKIVIRERKAQEKIEAARLYVNTMEKAMKVQEAEIARRSDLAEMGKNALKLINELTGPLAVISGSTEILLSSAKDNDGRDDLERIRRGIDIMEKILRMAGGDVPAADTEARR